METKLTPEVVGQEAAPEGKDAKALTLRTSIESGERGLELRSIEDLFRFAKYVAASGLAPKGMEKVESILVAIQMGAEVGLSPMAALQNIAVINGRPSIWGDAQLAVCRARSDFDDTVFDEHFEGDFGKETFKAVCIVARKGGLKQQREFSIEDAKRADLWGKNVWKGYPKRMLQMRARSWALRDTFPDALRGFKQAEEAMDIVDVEAQVASEFVEPRRASTKEEEASPDVAQPSPAIGAWHESEEAPEKPLFFSQEWADS